MLVSLDAADGRSISLAIDLTWCRFTRFGWYESGGRFLRVVRIPPPPMPSAQEPISAAESDYQI